MIKINSGLRLAAVLATALSLSACLSLDRREPMTPQSATDDDTHCRANGGPPGSDGYAQCLKNRDSARAVAVERADRTHRNLTERMRSGQ